MADTNGFKSKLFGGFDRKDVANYIEKMAAERNEYQRRCRELEDKLDKCESEIESLKTGIEEEKESLRAKFEAEKDALIQEYEDKLTEAEAAVVCANLKAEERRTEEKDQLRELLAVLTDKFSSAESDISLLCAHMLTDLTQAQKTMERIPEILSSSKDRLADIKETVK